MARSIWSKLTGYNRQVEIESAIARWKGLYGANLKNRSEIRAKKEVLLKAIMINQMIDRQERALKAV